MPTRSIIAAAPFSLSLPRSLSLSVSLAESVAFERVRARPSLLERLGKWLTSRSRARLVRAERALLQRFPHGPYEQVLSLDGLRGSSGDRLALLRAARSGSRDVVVAVAVLANADDVGATLAEIRRVLRPGGRLLFVEPVAARAGTRLRAIQRMLAWPWSILAGTVHPLRDLWNDLKMVRLQQVSLDHVSVAALGLVPIPHIVGEAVRSAATAAAPSTGGPMADSAIHQRPNLGPALAAAQPGFAFFG